MVKKTPKKTKCFFHAWEPWKTLQYTPAPKGFFKSQIRICKKCRKRITRVRKQDF